MPLSREGGRRQTANSVIRLQSSNYEPGIARRRNAYGLSYLPSTGDSLMYCPKCGQQASDNMRFCSRCGLPISEVADWLAVGGTTAALGAPAEAPPPVLSPKRKGMRRGAKVMFWSGALIPIFFALSIAADSPIPLILPSIIFLAGLSWLLYSRLFGEESTVYGNRQAQDMKLGAAPTTSALPPANDAGISTGGGRTSRTAEMAQPPSVTDHTTKLLKNE